MTTEEVLAPGTGDVIVRVARAGDLPAILALYVELADGRPAALPAEDGVADEVFDAVVRQPSRALLVALVEGTAVGVIDTLVVPSLTHTGRPWMIVENLIVGARFRRRGVGRALIGHALRHAENVGCYKVQLLSRKSRTEAHAFYLACGFEAVAEGFRRYLE